MKTTNYFLIFSLLSMAYVGEAQSLNRFHNSQTVDVYFSYKADRKRPLILAHRGGPEPADTENSITTFDKIAKVLPNAIIEMDVRQTRDGHFILLHDSTLERESDATGPVAEKTLAEVKNVKLKTLEGKATNQLIPVLTDVLKWNKNRYMLALDVKPGTDPLLVIDEVEKHKAIHSVFVICYSMSEAQKVRDRYPLLWLAVGVSSMDDIKRFEVNPLAKTGRLIALTPQKIQPILFYERLHKLGVLCSVGTYGDGQLDEQSVTEAAAGYHDLVKKGGDIITTDRPVEVSKVF